MIAEIRSGAVSGIDGYGVSVEIDLARGLPSFTIVGLPNAAVRESRERVCAALRNYGFKVPQKKLTVNLAPADVRKEGASLDLPIALGILTASGQIECGDLKNVLFLGELALDGRLKHVRGVLPVACYCRREGFDRIVIPDRNGTEACFVKGLEIAPCRNLGDVLDLLGGGRPRDVECAPGTGRDGNDGLDYGQVAGHSMAKRALQVAAAGGHHVLMYGPPGSGKTMLARRLPTIMPPMDDEEALECAKIASVTGLSGTARITFERPFRAPHHSTSDSGLVGGGRNASPGEITLAHNGILFMDEFTEFRRNVLETLRQPVEEGCITISRANACCRYPARFQLIAAMNPCPCGHGAGGSHPCRCTPLQVKRYLSRISGPLLDRIAIHLQIRAVPADELSRLDAVGETDSASLRTRVLDAVRMQEERYCGDGRIRRNSDLPLSLVGKYCALEEDAGALLHEAQKKLKMSGRSRKNVIQVARTIADLELSAEVTAAHVSEALQYRAPAYL